MAGGYELRVREWDESNFMQGLDFCDANAPFRDQPRVKGPSSRCSAFLVGPSLAITAGHCISPESGSPRQVSYSCSERFVVAGFADLFSTPLDELIFVPSANVRQCSMVRIDALQGPASDELLAPSGTVVDDYAVLELMTPFDDILPLVPETFIESAEGASVALIGHPQRIPMKIETSVLNADRDFLAHVLHGHSGSAVVSLETGKVFGNAVGATPGLWTDFNGPDGIPGTSDDCVSLDFAGPGVTTTSNLAPALAPFIDPLGLQLTMPSSGQVVEYYGPPTNGADFNLWNTTLSVPDDSLPDGVTELAWAIDNSAGLFDISETAGTLPEGSSVNLLFQPANALIGGQGVHEVVLPIFDYTYETREPLVHRVHVGVDGFTVWPEDSFDGEGLGVEDGETMTYTASNRWWVDQDMQVEATAPWMEFLGPGGGSPVPGDTPLPFTLTPAHGIVAPTFPLEVSMN